MEETRTFSTKDAANITGLTYRQVDHWVRSGFLTPDTAANGSGSRRRLSYEDLMKLSLAKALSNAGVPLAEAFELIDDIKDRSGTAENELIVIADGKPNFLQFSNAEASKAYRSILRNGKVVTTVNVAGVRDSLDASIFDFKQSKALSR